MAMQCDHAASLFQQPLMERSPPSKVYPLMDRIPFSKHGWRWMFRNADIARQGRSCLLLHCSTKNRVLLMQISMPRCLAIYADVELIHESEKQSRKQHRKEANNEKFKKEINCHRPGP